MVVAYIWDAAVVVMDYTVRHINSQFSDTTAARCRMFDLFICADDTYVAHGRPSLHPDG